MSEEKKTPYAPRDVALGIWQDEIGGLVEATNDTDETVREKKIRAGALAAIKIGDKVDILVGELLTEIKYKQYWEGWGHPSFDAYVEAELDFKRRKAYYLIELYEKLVIELDVPGDCLRDLEWSKVKEVTKYLTPANWREVLDKVSKMTLREVHDYVTTEFKKETLPADDLEPFTVKLSVEQRETIDRALGVAEGIAESKANGHLIELICADFLSGHVCDEEDKFAYLDNLMARMARMFDVAITIEPIEDTADADALFS